MIRILYFARLRETLGLGEESLQLPEAITTAAELHSLLCERSDAWHQALTMDGLLVAVNQTVVAWDHPLSGSDEVAFFPPVTGG